MFNPEEQAKHFKNHIATFTDYGNIKILDFKSPNSSEYRIRFLFEEDYCILHISGDLGKLTATNFSNMKYEKFSDFVNNTGYFEEKIDCHSRALYCYDETKAREELRQFINENDLPDEICENGNYDTIDDFIYEVLEDFDDSRGLALNSTGYGKLSEEFPDAWEFAGELGREETGILQLYMLAFKLAQKQLLERSEDNV